MTLGVQRLDRVHVDLTGLYLALCGSCGATTLAVPGGWCSSCHAPEARLVADPADLRGEGT